MLQIFQNYNVKKLLRPKLLVEGEFENGFSYSTDTAYIETISSARNEKGCEISYIDSGKIYSNEEFVIEILYPSLSENLAEAESNDYSAVIRVEYKGYKYLFMADATSDIEKKLMQNSLFSVMIKIRKVRDAT